MDQERIGFVLMICVLGVVGSFTQKTGPTPKPEKPRVKSVVPVPSAANKVKADEFFKQGKALWDKFEIRPAIESYSKAIELDPNHVAALSERGIVYFMIGESQNAIPDFDRVLQSEPNNVKSYIIAVWL